MGKKTLLHSQESHSSIGTSGVKTTGYSQPMPESENGFRLLSHGSDFSYSVNDYVKVKGEVSPFNGDTTYWTTRKGSHPELSTRVATLLKKQKGRCAHCGLTFRDEDILEVDHIIP